MDEVCIGSQGPQWNVVLGEGRRRRRRRKRNSARIPIDRTIFFGRNYYNIITIIITFNCLADFRDLPQFPVCIFSEIVIYESSSRAVTCKGGSTKRLAEETVDINGVCQIFLLDFQSVFHQYRRITHFKGLKGLTDASSLIISITSAQSSINLTQRP
jgi:hypothetical protein